MVAIRRIICIALILCSLPISASALNLVTSDYDNDKWEIETITYNSVDTIPDGWYPLRAVSEYLPIDVSWDNENRQIIIRSDDLHWENETMRTYKYSADSLSSELVIKDGITYCSPRFLSKFLSNTGFFYNGEIYCFVGEISKSKLINDRGNEDFRARVLTVLYQFKLMLPDTYAMVRDNLTGGFKMVYKDELTDYLSNADAFVNTKGKNPVCKIVKNNNIKSCLASYIAHEAYHVYQYRTYGITGEEYPTKYGNEIYNKFIQLMYAY